MREGLLTRLWQADIPGTRLWPRGPVVVERLLWLLPIVVLFLSRRATDSQMQLVVAGVLGIGAFIVVIRHPAAALTVMVVLMPIQLFLLSGLYTMGFPPSLLRAAGSYRDVVVLGVVIAALRNLRATGRRLDVVDKLAIAYVALLVAYLFLPGLLTTPKARAGQPPPNLDVRLLAFRLEGGMVLLFLGARHLAVTAAQRRRLVIAAVSIGMVVAGMVIFEFLSSSTWNTFVVNTLRVPTFEADVFNTPLPSIFDIRQYTLIAGTKLPRPGSAFLSPLTTGFYLLIPFALSVERLTRRRAPAIWYLAASAAGIGLILTYVRSAVLGGVVVAFAAFGARANQATGQRVRLALAVVAGLLLFAPVVATSGFATRTSKAFSTSGQSADENDRSTSDHIAGLQRGVKAIGEHPMGAGLGSAPGIGDRFNTVRVLTENAYLQVGIETGVIAMVMFVVLIILVLRALRRAGRAPPALARACYAAGLGLAVCGMFLHVWNGFAVSLTYWGLAGVALAPFARDAGAENLGVDPGAGVPAEVGGTR